MRLGNLDPIDQEEMDFQGAVPGFNLADLNKRASTRDSELDSILAASAGNQPAPLPEAPAPIATPDSLPSDSPAPEDDGSEISRLLAYLKPAQSTMEVSGDNFAKGGVELDKAIKDRDDEIKANRIGAAGQTIADALAPGTGKIGNEFYDQGIKLADRKMEDYKKKVDNQKNDPESEYSSGLRTFAKKFGITVPDNVSGETMEKLLPYVSRAYDSDVDNKARVLTMVENRNARSEEKEKTRGEKKEKDYNDFLTKQSTIISNSAEAKDFNKIQQVQQQIKSAISNPNGVKDISALYGVVKALDPDSVVRPGEIELSQRAAGIWSNLKTALSRAGKNPRVVDTKVLKLMDEYINEVSDAKRQSYQKRLKPVEEQVKKRGGALEDLTAIAPSYDDIKKPIGQKPAGKKVAKKEFSPSRNQTRITYADGSTEVVDGKQ